MNHSWHPLDCPRGSGRARTRSGLAICEPAIPELRRTRPSLTFFLALVCLQQPQPHYRSGPWMTLRPVNNPAAGAAQRTRTAGTFQGVEHLSAARAGPQRGLVVTRIWSPSGSGSVMLMIIKAARIGSAYAFPDS